MKKNRLQIIVIFVLCGLPSIVFSQYKEEDVVTFLTNNTSKLWFFDRYATHMGGGDSSACTKGESYTFTKDRKVKHSKCVNGSWSDKTYTWKIESESPFDWLISFNGKKYYVIHSATKSKEELKLRTRTESKTDVSEDIILKFYKDE